jgi:hypothetical protein
VPGHNAYATFSATAGQRASLQLSSVTGFTSETSSAEVTILKPDGTNLFAPAWFGTDGDFIDPVTLPVTGTYKVFVDPWLTETGSVTLKVWNVPANPTSAVFTPNATGTTVALTTTTPGQVAVVPFAETAGHRLSANLTTTIGTASPTTSVEILRPDGSPLYSPPDQLGTGGLFIEPKTLPVTGTYKLVVDPQTTDTGSVTVTLWDVPADVNGGSLGANGNATDSIGTPGQQARITVTGLTGGQTYTLTLSNVTIGSDPTYTADVHVVDGSGNDILGSPGITGTSGNSFQVTPAASGTYTIVVDPLGANTGSIKVALS